MGTAVKHPVPDWVKSSFVIFDIWALWHSGLSVRVDAQGWAPTVGAQSWASECPDVKNYKWWLNPVWHRMLYSCTHMATVGIKRLTLDLLVNFSNWFKPNIRGAIKKFSAWPSYVQNKIKIVFASYGSKARNTTCTIWLLATYIFCILAVVGYLHSKWKKADLHSVMKWQFDRFVRSVACFVVLTQNRSGGSSFHP